MITAELPQVSELSPRDVTAILARNITGRIAFIRDGEIEIRPVSYVFAEGCIYLRTSAAAALSGSDAAGERVGFEVDEIHSTAQWRSVVVRGTLFRLTRDGEYEEWMRAVGKLRRLMPEALRDEDPLSHRGEVFRIVIREATGRMMG